MPILGIQASEGLAPGAPTIGTATAGDTSATVAYTAPTWTGKGSGAVTYTATSSPGNFTGTGSSPITVSGLTNGTAYTFTVKATTSYGVTGLSSAASNSVTPVSLINSYESIATVTVGAGGSSSVSFSSIPSTYKHLQLRAFWKLGSGTNLTMNINSDTGSNYKTHALYGDGGSVSSFVSSVSPTAIGLGYVGGSAFSITIADILDYTNTNKNTTVRYLMGDDRNGSGEIEYGSGLWINTNAVSSLTIQPQGGTTIQQYSSFALYGVKG